MCDAFIMFFVGYVDFICGFNAIDNVFDCWNGGWLKSLVYLYGSVINCLSLLRICSFFRGSSAEILNFSFLFSSRSFLFDDEGGDNMFPANSCLLNLFCAQSILVFKLFL